MAKPCAGALKKAERRMRDAAFVEQAAKDASNKAEAEWARLQFLNYAEEHPTLKAFGFDVAYEYNDEGYDLVTNFHTDPYEVNDDWSFSDFMSSVSREAITLLCAGSPGDESGTCTVAEARKRRF